MHFSKTWMFDILRIHNSLKRLGCIMNTEDLTRQELGFFKIFSAAQHAGS